MPLSESDNTEADASTPCDVGDNVLQSSADAVQHRIALTDIASRNDIDGLSVRQLKSLLVNHYVDYKGCCEKQELVERVHELWMDRKKLTETGESVALSVLQRMLLKSVGVAKF